MDNDEEEKPELSKETKEAIKSIEKMESLSAEQKAEYIERLQNGEDQYAISEEILKKLEDE